MSERDKILVIYSALIGFLGAISFILTAEVNRAKEQERRASEDAVIRHNAARAGDV
jgi:hypothetical protein